MDGLVSFALTVAANGEARVILDDVDVTALVGGADLHVRKGTPPILSLLELGGAGVVQGEGIVRVVADAVPRQDDGALRSAVAAWLDGLDPEALEAAALARLDLGNEKAGVLFLETLKEWARGSA